MKNINLNNFGRLLFQALQFSVPPHHSAHPLLNLGLFTEIPQPSHLRFLSSLKNSISNIPEEKKLLIVELVKVFQSFQI